MARSPVSADPLLEELRRQILDLDHSIVTTMNARLRLVAQLKRYKASLGLDFLDRGREERMLEYLREANGGPLSEDGLEELFAKILDLTKREVTQEET
jgi:chorismate mutase